MPEISSNTGCKLKEGLFKETQKIEVRPTIMEYVERTKLLTIIGRLTQAGVEQREWKESSRDVD